MLFFSTLFGLILIACVTGLVIIDTDIEVEETTNYYDTKLFSNNYFNSIYSYFYIPVLANDQSNNQSLIATEESQVGEYTEYQDSSYERYGLVEYYGYDVQEGVMINGKKRNNLLQ